MVQNLINVALRLFDTLVWTVPNLTTLKELCLLEISVRGGPSVAIFYKSRQLAGPIGVKNATIPITWQS